MADVTDLDGVFASIVAERGGRVAFSIHQLAAAHRLAQILADGSGGSVAAIATLVELLPPKTEKRGKPADWSLATDKELDMVERVLAKVHGEVPPPRTKRKPQPLWFREAVAVARSVERIARRVNPPAAPPYDELLAAKRAGQSVERRPPQCEAMTDGEVDELYQAVCALLAPLGMLAYSIVGLGPAVERDRLVRENAAAAPSTNPLFNRPP